MRFCDSNHEITQTQQEEKQQHHKAEINFMLMRIQKYQKFQVSSNMHRINVRKK